MQYFFAFCVLACLFLVYSPIIYKMALRWNADDNSYCYLVFPLFFFLCWDKMKTLQREGKKALCQSELDFAKFSWNFWGLVPVLIAAFLMVFAEISAVETLLYTGFFVCILGILLSFYGDKVRYLFFPLLVLFFFIPLPPFINRVLTFHLKLAASSISTILLRTSGVSVLREGNVIELGVSQLQVVDACSGLRYLVPLFLIALLVGYFFHIGLWKRVVLCSVAAPLSIIVNALRIWVTGILAVNGYESLANSFFHNFSGVIVFLFAGASLVSIALIFKGKGEGGKVRAQKINRPKEFFQMKKHISLRRAENRSKSENLKVNKLSFSSLLKPAAIATVLCVLFCSSGWALKRIPSRNRLPERASFTSFPMEIGQWKGRLHDISEKIMDGLWADDFVSATFKREDSKNYISLFIPFYEYQSSRHTAHTPKACMLGGGWALIDSRERQIPIEQNKNIRIETMTWQKGNQQVLGGYFFLQRGRIITTPLKNKFYLMWDALSKRRTDGALVRVEMILAPGQSDIEANDELNAFLVELMPILHDYIPG